MKVVHYKNIGYPKTGTTWLWAMLMRHPLIDGKVRDEDKEYNPEYFDSYKKKYEKFDISVNLNPLVFDKGTKQKEYNRPEKIHEYTTHCSLTFRNFYEVMQSTYNMLYNIDETYRVLEPEEYIEENYKNFSNIDALLSYWKPCKLKIEYFLFDDLVNDPKNYFHKICDYLGVARFYKDIGIIFPTPVHKQLTFQQKHIQYINDNICILEDILRRDLSHWKK